MSADNNIVDNNISPVLLGTVGVSIVPTVDPPYPTLFSYPKFAGMYFCSDDADYGTQTFAIADDIDGDSFIQAGTFSKGLINFQIIVTPAVPEAFGIYDTATNALFAVDGVGAVTIRGVRVFDSTGKLSIASASGPTITIKPNAGVGATMAIVAGGSDNAFKVTMTSGSSGLLTGVWFHVDFSSPFDKVPVVVWSPLESVSNANSPTNCIVQNITATGFDYAVFNIPAVSFFSSLNFHVIG